MAQDNISKEAQRLNRLFRVAVKAQEDYKVRDSKREDEEFYFSDVDNTRSQFDQEQTKKIKSTYSIPITTKLTYAITEQLLSFITATKPFPRLISTEESTQDFTLAYEKGYHATFYESRAKDKITKALRDLLTTGLGWLHVRKPDFFNESTTNVIIDYEPWKKIFVDPESQQSDFNDAEFIMKVDIMRKDKAEKVYDITIPDDVTLNSGMEDFRVDMFQDLYWDFIVSGDRKDIQQLKYVWTKEIYEKEDINVYVGSNPYDEQYGIVSLKRPVPTRIPNPERANYQRILDGLIQQQQQAVAGANVSAGLQQSTQNDPNLTGDDESFVAGSQMVAQDQQNFASQSGIALALDDKIKELQSIIAKLPTTIPAYEMTRENATDKDAKITVTEVVRQKQRRIKRSLMVGDMVIEQDLMPGDMFPLIPFVFAHANNPNKTYGLIHYIKDICKGMNKYLAEIMYAIATTGHRKGFVWENTIVEPKQLEDNTPYAWIKLRPVPDLPDGGKPIILEPAPLNQALYTMLEYYKTMAEYITGIFGVMQGNAQDAPNTYGATQSLQSFGTQRVKLYSRQLERSFENLAYVVVNYMQAYTPREKVLKYFDDNGDGQEVSLMNSREDLQFKVRVEIVNSLPTTRQSTAQILGFIAQTAGDPTLTALYTEYLLKILDVPEAKEIAQKVDIVKQLQSQLIQLQQQVETMTKQQTSMDNMMQQKEAGHKVDMIAAEAQRKSDLMSQEQELGQGDEQEEELPQELQ